MATQNQALQGVLVVKYQWCLKKRGNSTVDGVDKLLMRFSQKGGELMTVRERFFNTISHKQPDIVPYHINFTKEAFENMAAYCGGTGFLENIGNCFTRVGFDLYGKETEIRPNIFEDRFGVHWDKSVDKDIGVVCNRLVTEDTFESYRFPDPDDQKLYADVQHTIDTAGDTVLLGGLGFATFERAWSLMGMEPLLEAMILNKPLVHELFKKITDYNLKVAKNACEFKIDGIGFGDDWGQQTGLIMGPDLWREFIKPCIKKLFGYVKSQGKFVFIHSCGNVQEIFPDIIECGVDIFNPFQPEVMDVFEIKRLYGDKLSFYGGISTQRTLPYGTVKETVAEVNMLLEKIGHNGGYIASPAHDIPKDAKPENVMAMIEVLRNQS